MSKVDDVFGPIPGPLMQEWGQDVVFVQQTGSTYDANTGAVTKNTTSYNVKAVITKLYAPGTFKLACVKRTLNLKVPDDLDGSSLAYLVFYVSHPGFEI